MEKKKSKLIFITGGARSGKSTFAESLALKTGKKIVYIATGQALDEEMEERIAEHRRRRPKNWQTFEEPEQVDRVIREIGQETDIILVDCLTLLVSNLISDFKEDSSREDFYFKINSKIGLIAEAALKSNATIIIVSNEVGSGLVPDNPMGRFFRDMLGKANQSIAGKADQVYLVVSGIPLLIKGSQDE